MVEWGKISVFRDICYMLRGLPLPIEPFSPWKFAFFPVAYFPCLRISENKRSMTYGTSTTLGNGTATHFSSFC